MHVTVSIFRNVKDVSAVREQLDLTDFRQPALSELEPSAQNASLLKAHAPAFAPAVFKEDRRKKANIEHAQVLVYDIDQDIDGRELSERLRRRGISFAIHSTTRAGFSLAETGRGRVHVLIPLAKPVDQDTYLKFWDEARAIFHGLEVDMSKRGAESLFFAPVIFEAHKNCYYFDCDVDAPRLGSSGFKPFRPTSGPDAYVSAIRDSVQKHVALNKGAFVLGLMGVSLEETKTRCLQALRDNVASEPVVDWHAAETTIVKAWTDGEAQAARPKHVPDSAKSTGLRVLRSAVDAIHKGRELQTCAYQVGQFVPHVIAFEDALDELLQAWARAKNHDTQSRLDATSAITGGLEAGMRSPKGIFDEWKKELKPTQDGLGFHPGFTNIHIVIERHPNVAGLLAYDVRDGSPVYLSEPPWHAGRKLEYPRRLEDEDRQLLARWVRNELDVSDTVPNVAFTALVDVAKQEQYDALLDYFKALPSTNETDVLETVLIETLGAPDTPYVRAVTKKWFIGLVARQFQPGCRMDNVLITVGDQGLGKSTFFCEIFPRELQDKAFTDSLNVLKLERDQIIKLSRYAVVEISELAAMRKADIESVKMVVSQRTGDERAAYAQIHKHYPRRAVFAGTTNRPEFLTDPTGNRRFWPVNVTSRLDLEKLRKLRNALWGQAVSAYLRGDPWHLGVDEEALANDVRTGHEEEDPLADTIDALLREWPGDSKYDDPTLKTYDWQLEGRRVIRARTGQLMLKLGSELTNRTVERRVVDVLRKRGWVSKSERHEGRVYRIWLAKTAS